MGNVILFSIAMIVILLTTFIRSGTRGLTRPTEYAKNTNGAIIILFAIVAPFMIATVGMALDYAHAYLVQQRLQQSIDAAALAATAAATDSNEIEQRLKNFFEANYPPEKVGYTFEPNVQIVDNEVIVTGRAKYNTYFLRIIGIDSIDVTANTTVKKIIGNNIELSLVLDISGSMQGEKISDLKEAAKSLVDIIVYSNQTEFYSKVAIVPYSVSVNVGEYAADVRGTYKNTTCTSPGCKYYKFKNPYNQDRTFQVSTCVSERTGEYAYTDDPPSTAYVGFNYPASGNPCLSSKIVPLTNDKDLLKSKIDALVATGSTGGQVGVGWGWYLLSPNFANFLPEESTPAPYDTKDLYKVAVIMTDGEYNSPYCNGVIAKDATSGSGSTSDHINCYATNGNAYSQSKTMCDAMKEAGIEVYTIGFKVSQYPKGEELMEYCASDTSHFYLADDGDELKKAFEAIANNVSSIYLSR